jgi:multidrug efflux system membrane fusion protein
MPDQNVSDRIVTDQVVSDRVAHGGLAPRRPRLRLWWLLALLGLAAALALFFFFSNPPPVQHTAMAPAITVRAAVAVRGDIPIVLQGLGVVTPFATVVVRAQINGQLQSIGFREGQTVHQGDFLAQIDPRPYEAALAQAQGLWARDQALLEQAQTDLIRYRQLLLHNDISQKKYEDQVFLIRQHEGTLAADQAQIANARLNLAYCRITAPITGRAGLRLVDPGNLVQSGDPAGIVVIAQLQPISVLFSLPQDDLPQVMRSLDAAAALPVAAYDRRNETVIEKGVLESLDNMVDVATGTAKLRARFANQANALFPNQFISARLQVDTLRDAVVVPEAAIQEGADGRYVWLVGNNHRVSVRRVTVGPAAAGRVGVLEGLLPDAIVVIDGADRLREGARVALASGNSPP